jgi:adenylate kinase
MLNTSKNTIIGTAGAGKGTQSELLSKEYNLVHLSFGDLLRKECRDDTQLGSIVKMHLRENGERSFCPDEIPYGVLLKTMAEEHCQKGFILDGFPRTPDQSSVLMKAGIRPTDMHIPIVLYVPDDDIFERLKLRHICPDCGRQVRSNDSLPEIGQCPNCKKKLVKREEDKTREKIAARLLFFRENLPGVIESISIRDRVHIVRADNKCSTREIFRKIKTIVDYKISQNTLKLKEKKHKNFFFNKKTLLVGSIFCACIIFMGIKFTTDHLSYSSSEA